MTKTCNRCLRELPVDSFSRKACGKYGRDGQCRACRKVYQQAYQKQHGPRLAAMVAARRHQNPELYRLRNRASEAARLARDPDFKRNYMRRYMRERLRSDVPFRLLAAARNRLYEVLARTRRPERTVELLGCSPAELKVYLENKFQPGWAWDDWGVLFEIDHIKPCASFDMTDAAQRRACFHYTNLQPLAKELNRKKWCNFVAA